MKKNVKEVFASELCLSCGLCVSLCPNGNIEIQLDRWGNYSIIVSEKCSGCGLCLKCCPGVGVDFDLLNQETFGQIPSHPYLGHVVSTYIGWATDVDIRRTSASGGIITTVGTYLLQTGKVDGICVVRSSDDDPLLPEIFIARTQAEMLSAAQSKYYPVPINIGLKSILNEEGRFAIVGKPCDIHGIRKAAQSLPKIREKIHFFLGIMCMWGGSRQGILNWLHAYGIKDYKLIKSIRFREGDWPGRRVAYLKNGRQISPSVIEAFVNPFILFCPKRCLLCPDQTNELSDMAVGDAWVSDISQYRGTAVVVARSNKGLQILKESKETNLLDLQEVPHEKVLESQDYMLFYKKIGFQARMKHWPENQKPTFKISNFPNIKPAFSDRLAALTWHLFQKISRSILGYKVIKHLPPYSYEWLTKALFKWLTNQYIFKKFNKPDFHLMLSDLTRYKTI